MSNTTNINDGGQAFPILRSDQAGMSLRDWFAGQALNGILANSTHISEENAANWSFQFADAMIAARNNPPSQP